MWAIIGSLLFGSIVLQSTSAPINGPKEITEEWESRVLGVRHGPSDLAGSLQEMTEGLIDDFFGKDFIQRLKEAVEKSPTGEYVEYWENGALKVRLPYKDRKANGHLHGWYDNGRDAFKGYFKEGIKQGIHITFYYTKQEYITKKARILWYSLSGQLTEKQMRFHPSGHLWCVIKYEEGRANGPLEAWNENRKQVLSVDYKNGLLKKDPPLPPEQRPRPKRLAYAKPVDEVIGKFAKQAKKEFDVNVYGAGGSMPFDVETIDLRFAVVKRGSIEEGRRLMVLLKERLADIVNQDEQLIPYLREYPFSPLRSDIFISFSQKNGKDYNDGSISFIVVGRGNKVFYNAYNQETRKTEIVFEEPYEEAVKIVKQNVGSNKSNDQTLTTKVQNRETDHRKLQ